MWQERPRLPRASLQEGSHPSAQSLTQVSLVRSRGDTGPELGLDKDLGLAPVRSLRVLATLWLSPCLTSHSLHSSDLSTPRLPCTRHLVQLPRTACVLSTSVLSSVSENSHGSLFLSKCRQPSCQLLLLPLPRSKLPGHVDTREKHTH